MKGDDLQAARERNGDAVEDRPERIDDILAPQERVGFKNELPLLERDYADYPEGDDILRPEAGDALRTLADHPLVSSAEDIADELGTTVGKVETATDLHGVELPEGGFDVEVDTSRLDALLSDDWPEAMRKSDNPITVTTLYLEGLSVSEIADVLEDDMGKHTVREGEVRQTLVDAGVLKGETTAEAEFRRKQNRGEVNQFDNGVTVDATDL